MASRPSKAMKIENTSRQVSTCDQLSKLPDSIIIHILSFLPTFDAVYRAGFVSKRFVSLRLSLPSLVFRNKDIPFRQEDKLSRYINDVLVSQHRDNLRRCCFHIPYHPRDDHELIDTWIKLTLDRKVKELEISLVRSNFRRYYLYCLPRFLFRNEILTSLSLSRVGFKVAKEMQINWKSLKSLSMKRITDLNDDMLGKILIGCPILELLELKSCEGIHKLDVVSQCLKELVIYDCVSSYKRGEILRVSAPSLRVLVISGSNHYNECTLENLSSLVEATIDSDSDSDSDGDDNNGEDENEDDEDGYEYDDGIDFFGSVQHVKKLTLLGTWNLHVSIYYFM
ncbi:F-box/LRR-repeat protein 25-like [Beta vulgaris subsp. vulgaris]|uniref:F-box/LRR-repeat protein 25-like n=1 Tax=Beta vulgaris subsp. vulgaris TaxID=3555 RepID=UPI00053F2B8A|nr:F-box/LRR-repeat protein 25-like [Beta vulgaris subsp. vulgaris]